MFSNKYIKILMFLKIKFVFYFKNTLSAELKTSINPKPSNWKIFRVHDLSYIHHSYQENHIFSNNNNKLQKFLLRTNNKFTSWNSFVRIDLVNEYITSPTRILYTKSISQITCSILLFLKKISCSTFLHTFYSV